MITQEIEKAGIPAAQITTLLPVAKAVGPNRIVPGLGIMFPVGDTGLAAEEEKELRRSLVQQALDALASEVS